jgi:hypothetical protein
MIPPPRSTPRPGAATFAAGSLALAAALLLGGCLKPFEVNVNTPEPIKVDLSMDVNVYQHGAAEKKKEEAPVADFRSAMDGTRNRMAEIQELKNSRLVGENRSGLLTVKTRPAGQYGDYVDETVSAENRDRDILMRHEAEEKGTELSKVREEHWRHRQRKSFPGEWIEVADENGTTYRWIKKQAAVE